MKKDLDDRIQQLYDTFSVYPLNRGMDACPCCVKDTDKMRLLSKPLRELAAGDLSKYYWKAMTTWGGVDDFKHFLPRLFELIVTDNIRFSSFIIFDNLEYGNWETWNLAEIESIKSVIEAWWINSTLLNCQFEGDNFVYFVRALGSVQPLINNWDVSVESNSFRNLIFFILNNL